MVVAAYDGIDGLAIVPEEVSFGSSGAIKGDYEPERILPTQHGVRRRFLSGHDVATAYVNGNEVVRSVKQNVLAIRRNFLSLKKDGAKKYNAFIMQFLYRF